MVAVPLRPTRASRARRRVGRTVAALAASVGVLAAAPGVAAGGDVAAAPGVAAGGAVAAAPPTTGGERLLAVQRVLDARAAAVRTGNAAAFLATVDPEAPPEFRAAQARSFAGWRSLPLASFHLEARTEDTGDLGRAAGDRYSAEAVFLPETRLAYRFEGYDDRDAVERLWLTFVQRRGRWYVGGDTDLEGVGLDTARHLWDFGPVELRRTPSFLVLSHPEQAARAAAVAELAEQAVATLARVWDQPWSRRIPMVLPGSVEELERILQSTIDLDKFVAFVSYDLSPDTGYVATAPRVYLQDARLGQYGRAFQVATLVHELAHAAAAPLAGPFVPAWVHEGVAEWVAAGRPGRERPPGGADRSLPRDFEFTTGSSASILRAYRESRAAVSLLAADQGAGVPTDLLRTLGQVKFAPGSVDHRVDVALRRLAGLSLADLERRWSGS